MQIGKGQTKGILGHWSPRIRLWECSLNIRLSNLAGPWCTQWKVVADRRVKPGGQIRLWRDFGILFSNPWELLKI